MTHMRVYPGIPRHPGIPTRCRTDTPSTTWCHRASQTCQFCQLSVSQGVTVGRESSMQGYSSAVPSGYTVPATVIRQLATTLHREQDDGQEYREPAISRCTAERPRITALRSLEPRISHFSLYRLFNKSGNALKRSSLVRYTLAYLLGQLCACQIFRAETEVEPGIVNWCSESPRGGSVASLVVINLSYSQLWQNWLSLRLQVAKVPRILSSSCLSA